ncbi:hypothetical protein ABZP36_032074 [Zizania latifolia]
MMNSCRWTSVDPMPARMAGRQHSITRHSLCHPSIHASMIYPRLILPCLVGEPWHSCPVARFWESGLVDLQEDGSGLASLTAPVNRVSAFMFLSSCTVWSIISSQLLPCMSEVAFFYLFPRRAAVPADVLLSSEVGAFASLYPVLFPSSSMYSCFSSSWEPSIYGISVCMYLHAHRNGMN